MTQVAEALGVRPQSGRTGAEIHGVDLTAELRADQVAEIRAGLLKWKVVFFRDQFISHDDHLRFARAFGAPTPAHPLFDAIPDPDYPTIYPIFRDRFKARYGSSRGYDKAGWHADVTAAVNPPAASILRASRPTTDSRRRCANWLTVCVPSTGSRHRTGRRRPRTTSDGSTGGRSSPNIPWSGCIPKRGSGRCM